MGTELGDNIIKALKDKTQLFKDLAIKLGKTEAELAQYTVLREVPLSTTGGFMKADVVLVKKSADGLSIDDVIIIENKLSKTTDFTIRQKEGFNAIGKGTDINPTKMTIERPLSDGSLKVADGPLEVKPSKCFRISDHGKSSEAINLNIETIDYSKIKL